MIITIDITMTHDGSMVLLYMVCHGSHQYTPVMLAYIAAPWIRHGNGNGTVTEVTWNHKSK